MFTWKNRGNCPQGKDLTLLRADHQPGSKDLLILTRSPSDDNFSRIPPKTRTEIMTTKATL
jgi:hypothetical protein